MLNLYCVCLCLHFTHSYFIVSPLPFLAESRSFQARTCAISPEPAVEEDDKGTEAAIHFAARKRFRSVCPVFLCFCLLPIFDVSLRVPAICAICEDRFTAQGRWLANRCWIDRWCHLNLVLLSNYSSSILALRWSTCVLFRNLLHSIYLTPFRIDRT